MTFPGRSKLSRNGDAETKSKRENRKKDSDRREGVDRRMSDRRKAKGRLHMRDLYKTDLDRHLWAWPKSKKPARRRRTMVRLIASAAGMLGAAGLSYVAYKKLRKKGSKSPDPIAEQAESE